MPTQAAPRQTLKGKTGPDCLRAMACASVCRHAGGREASLAGRSVAWLPRQNGIAMYQDYFRCMPEQEDKEVSGNYIARMHVIEGLNVAADGFDALHHSLRATWTLQEMEKTSDAEKVIGRAPLEPARAFEPAHVA